MAHDAGLFPILQLILHAAQLDRIGLRDRLFQRRQPLLRLIHVGTQRIIPNQSGECRRRLRREPSATQTRVGIALLVESLVCLAEERVVVRQPLQPVGGGDQRALVVIESADAEFGLGQHFLNVAQLLLCRRGVLAVGELSEKSPALLVGAHRLVGIAIRFLHLTVVNVADPRLGLRGFLQHGVEQDEVLVFGLRIRQSGGAALTEPSVRDRQFGLGQILARVVRADQRLQGQARDVVAAPLQVPDGLVE